LAALFPAIQIHLIESTSSTAPLSRQLNAHKLQLCMMVLSELRDNYWGAAIAYRLFEEAQAKLHNRPQQHHRTDSIASNDSTSADHGKESTSLLPLTPSSNFLNVSQPRYPETQPTVLDDSLHDSGNFYSDDLASDLTFNTDAYVGSDMAAILRTVCADYTVDYGVGLHEFEFANSS
jgi:hypothetical protein